MKKAKQLDAVMLHNMANHHYIHNEYDEALTLYKEAFEIYPELMKIPATRANVTHILQKTCNWNDPLCDINNYKEYINNDGYVAPFWLLYQNASLEELQINARKFANIMKVYEQFQTYKHPCKLNKHGEKIRIGYLSGNWRNHPNSYLSLGVSENHDRNKFEIIGFSYGPDNISYHRDRIKKSFDQFINLDHLADPNAAKTISSLNVDILVDRQGYTTGYRPIARYRPAPIQINMIGYPGTMGTKDYDYILADDIVLPPEHEKYYDEKVLRMPNCYVPMDNHYGGPFSPIGQGLVKLQKNDKFIFACFNNSHKITKEVFSAWMKILLAVPDSILWLIAHNPKMVKNLQDEAVKAGINPDRLVFAPKVNRDEHIQRYHQVDLYLDTAPYNAHTTAMEALWCGAPVLTLFKDSFVGGVGASLIKNSLPEYMDALICTSLYEYTNIAISLARRRTLLEEMKAKLLNYKNIPLFNTEQYTRDLEKIYESLVR